MGAVRIRSHIGGPGAERGPVTHSGHYSLKSMKCRLKQRHFCFAEWHLLKIFLTSYIGKHLEGSNSQTPLAGMNLKGNMVICIQCCNVNTVLFPPRNAISSANKKVWLQNLLCVSVRWGGGLYGICAQFQTRKSLQIKWKT